MATTPSPFPNHRGHRVETVPDADLLALGETPWVVGDADLGHSGSMAGERRGDLGFDGELVLVEIGKDLPKHWHSDELVATLHVVDLEAGQPVRDEGQEAVGEPMDSANDVGLEFEPTVADDRVDGRIIESKGLDELNQIGRRVLEVGILNPDQIGRVRVLNCLGEPSSERRALAEVGGMTKEL